MAKDEICVIENMNGVDEVLLDVSIVPFWSHNFLNVKNVHHQQCNNGLLATSNEVYIQAME
jgi:hypothetical protein